jgi:hypothetical protein
MNESAQKSFRGHFPGKGAGRYHGKVHWPDHHTGLEAFQRGDYALALKQLVPQARKGDASAQYYVGRMFHEGKGVPEDNAIAFRWTHKAAQRGNSDGEALLGVLYAQGQGTSKDMAEAARWFHKAALKGNALAQCKLGLCNLRGTGVAVDYATAYMWFDVATANSTGHDQMCNCHLRDTFAAANLTPAQIAEAGRRAREFAPNFVQRLLHAV